mmetsp:Transcript_61441/g.121547  ORF Transcript_61441/g.121547 Transcript_61441/m.121547 type:complete len:521 (-) Transcript_61441:274-1836(-)
MIPDFDHDMVGRDFVDHEDVLFERFACDWQGMLRLGVAKMVGKYHALDAEAVLDEVGAVLLFHHMLTSLAWTAFADAVYASGSDVRCGVKLNQGWKAFTEECNIWSGMSEKDAACANSLIFMEVDRTDRMTSAAISIQTKFRAGFSARRVAGQSCLALDAPGAGEAASRGGGKELTAKQQTNLKAASRAGLALAADPSQELTKKADNQLNRIEFGCAIVKVAIERFIKSKELSNVGDAVGALFGSCIQPALEIPTAGREQPRLPHPDTFRFAVCYTRMMSEALAAKAPSLRVIFAGLAQLTFETARSAGVKVPKPGENKTTDRGAMQRIKVSGCVSYHFWRKFLEPLFPTIELRKVTLCFVYSLMAVIDGRSPEGSIKEQHLTFDSFLEALVRLATRLPLPTDAQIAASVFAHAGSYMAALEATDPDRLTLMAAEQDCEWGGTPDEVQAGNMPQRMTHLVDVIVHKIRQSTGNDADAPLATLTRSELRHWTLGNVQGAEGSMLPEKWAAVKQFGEQDAPH